MNVIDLNGQIRDCQKCYLDPTYPGFVTVLFVSKIRANHKHTEWYPLADFQRLNPEIYKSLGSPSQPPSDELGVVSHAGEFYLEDTSKNWGTNIFVGYMVWISRGPGEGQVRLVKSNSKNSLTIDMPWETVPNTKSQYLISLDIHDVKILDNQLPQFKQ